MKRLTIAALVTAAAGMGQQAIENWALPTGMNANQTLSVIETLNQPVLNRPFSGAAVVHTTHTLEDGTHVNSTSSTVLYRDKDGRRRTETEHYINISDPVAHASLTLWPDEHRATKQDIDGYVLPEAKLATEAFSNGGQKAGKKRASGPTQNVVRENLGTQTVNGVLCYGGRSTVIIPVGAIGNDREIKAVKETWTSVDLHILVKSTDSDPRFGTSTYDLTNITQAAPDATLFRLDVPSGYDVKTVQRMQLH
jgi:hypothetical protein